MEGVKWPYVGGGERGGPPKPKKQMGYEGKAPELIKIGLPFPGKEGRGLIVHRSLGVVGKKEIRGVWRVRLVDKVTGMKAKNHKKLGAPEVGGLGRCKPVRVPTKKTEA